MTGRGQNAGPGLGSIRRATGPERASAVLVAAGRGERLGSLEPKGRVLLAGRPLFLHSLSTLFSHPRIADVVLVVPPDEQELSAARRILEASRPPEDAARVSLAGGGAARRDSVLRGLEILEERGTPAEGLVLVHDAARPLLSPELVTRCLDAMAAPLAHHGQTRLPGLDRAEGDERFAAGVVPGLPVRETLKLVYEERVVVTQPRQNLWAAQTPQIFRFGALLRAHRRAARYGIEATDDAALLEELGLPVRMVVGDPSNLKVTYPQDLELAARLLAAAKPQPPGGASR